MKNQRFRLFITSVFLMVTYSFTACNDQKGEGVKELEKIELSYASGFTISRGNNFWVMEVTQAWSGADRIFTYLVLEENAEKPVGDFDAIIQLPVEKIILTSTTHIPHLDMLNETDKLIGFPNLNLISSGKTWAQIDDGKVEDLGAGPSANTEMVIDMSPDWIMISTLGDDLKYLDLLDQAKIPAVINGEYVEQHPLGRAEWIKFTGVLLGNFEEANAVFNRVENDYLEAEKLGDSIIDSLRPTVLSGVLYQDIWYAPGSESWGAKILENAGGNYIFSNQKGTGSAQFNYEFVLENSLEADFWIGSADFPDLQTMGNSEPRYKAFKAYQSGNVFSYTQKRGRAGGLEYFELGYMRPDLILKDLIKILHPALLPDYELYFYQQLNEIEHIEDNTER
ncbi:ABC transporter substrate-binding protein [Algoriphagus sp. D3-2-R+10]|uniref:ABC transporter substrate-binding protein n=1 Tax=Algoriphagus aurantiacus TaxID=3103948 RepID=UPI002B3C4C2E|nr:ABC transporter substrate-binding protein [Algoriphagus sp. D3-2-R+10]MEB2778215.1 ABC transporter substrate-binding protein [Algoriphagus sp. D3-2-R+10]